MSKKPTRIDPDDNTLLRYESLRSQVLDQQRSFFERSVGLAISKLLLESVTPLTLDMALQVQKELETRFNEADNLRKQQVNRAEYEAHLARRRFMQVDPDNRLVADTLEAEWNEKLRQLQEASDYYETHHRRESEKLKQTQEKAVLKLAKDFPKLWKNPKTPFREKKRMIRFFIEDVTLTREEDITLQVRFKGGATKTLRLPAPLQGWQYNMTDPKIVEIVDSLLTDQRYPSAVSERGVVANPDGSYDIYFVPQVPEGKESNWIQTIPGKGWNVILRFYGPLRPWFDQTWRPGDIERIN